ncbi:MAG TPA: NapC/NirT family cytochrome c [Clostridia bacterium]|nr:NapC/NirT family cytochrome c [Clostridia bacterium]
MADDNGSEVPQSSPEDLSLKSLVRNYTSLIGLALAVVALANIVFLFLIDITSKSPSPYIGILAYMIMPGFLILGLLLVPLGIWLERRRRRLREPSLPRFPRLDLNNPKQRSTVAFFISFVVLFVVLSAVGSYRAYEYTDSTQFCGQLCHSVMHPEFTAHQASPHARVRCVDCHVGTGAGWYVRSKLSGTRQVFKTALNTFPRPIETPIENLRPVSETCEQCHWPKKFFGAQLKVINHFSSDEKNTPRQLRLLLKTGGGDPDSGQAGGIHWHMNIANIITYASDPKRQNIPYVKMQDQKGNVTEFYAKDAAPDQIAKMSQRRMDCVDCHNRPTHIYMPPDRSVDHALTAHRIDPSLPYAKQQGVALLAAEYKSTDAAVQAIATEIPKFYQQKYPDVYASKRAEINGAVSELQRIFRTSIFPEMKVDWRTHPDNVGHFYFQGCFRCHDGNHVSKEGKTITKDCNVCHTLLAQEEGGVPTMGSASGVEFKHPIDLGDMSAISCTDCHNGGVGP